MQRTVRIVVIHILGLSIAASGGCGFTSNSAATPGSGTASLEKVSKELLREFDRGSEVYVVTGDNNIERQNAIERGSTMDVQGVFRSADVESDAKYPPVVTIKVVATSPKGSTVIQNSRSAKSAQTSKDQFKFSGQLKAPQVAGTYAVQAWRGQRLFTESRIEVR